MSLFDQNIQYCNDCDKKKLLSWSRDGNTLICAECKSKRGEREVGPLSERALQSEALLLSLRPQESKTSGITPDRGFAGLPDKDHPNV